MKATNIVKQYLDRISLLYIIASFNFFAISGVRRLLNNALQSSIRSCARRSVYVR